MLSSFSGLLTFSSIIFNTQWHTGTTTPSTVRSMGPSTTPYPMSSMGPSTTPYLMSSTQSSITPNLMSSTQSTSISPYPTSSTKSSSSPNLMGSTQSSTSSFPTTSTQSSTIASSTESTPLYNTIALSTPSTSLSSTIASSTQSMSFFSTIASSTQSNSLPSTIFSSTKSNSLSSTFALSTQSTSLSSTIASSTKSNSLSSTIASSTPSTKLSSTIASSTKSNSLSSTIASSTPSTKLSSTIASSTKSNLLSSTIASSTPSTKLSSTIASSTKSNSLSSTIASSTKSNSLSSTIASSTKRTSLSSTIASSTKSNSLSSTIASSTPSTKLSSTRAKSPTSSTLSNTTSASLPSNILSSMTTLFAGSQNSTLLNTIGPSSLNSTLNSTALPSTVNATNFNYPEINRRSDRESFPCETLKCIIVDRYRYETHDILVRLTILLTIIGFVGTVGNIIVITVFIRNKVKRNSTYFMLTLAIIDLMVCSIVIPGVIAREWRTSFYSDVLCKGLEFMRSLMIPSSAVILVAIALDRFFLICMSTKEVMTTCITKIIIGMIMLIGMALGIPPLLSVGILEDMGSDVQICVKSDKYLDDTAQYQYWYFVTVLFGAMIIAIMILYLLIFKKVIQQSNRWKNRPNKIFPERRSTGGNLHVKMVTQPSTTGQFDTIAPKQTHVTMVTDLESASSSDKSEILPSTSTNVGTRNSKTLKTRQSTHGISINSNTNIKTMSDMKKRSTHVKTTQVLFIVTIIYIISFLPTFLETNEVVENNKYLTYIYFVNNAANPIIYSFMNTKFREELKMLYCKCCNK